MILISGCSGQFTSEEIPGLIVQPRPGLSEYQLNIIQDGTITETEYRQAVTDHMLCVQEKGVETSDIELENNIRWTFGTLYRGYDGQDPQEEQRELDAIQKVYDDCQRKFASFIEPYYFLEQRPQGKEWDEEFLDFEACLEEYGVEGISSDMYINDIFAKLDTYGDEVRFQATWECYNPHFLLFYEWEP